MHKIDTPNANNNQFIDQDTANGIVGTSASAAWLNAIQDEIINVLIVAGIKPNKATNDQLTKAIQLIIDNNLKAIAFAGSALDGYDSIKWSHF